MAAYNAERTIEAALASVLGGTFDAIEVIVVDDASTDRTPAILAKVSRADVRVCHFRQQSNAGPSAARNRAIEAARGDWLALLDSDDRYSPNRLDTLVEVAERLGADLCSDNLLLVPEHHPAMARPMIPPGLIADEHALSLTEFVRRNVADAKLPGVNYGFLKPLIRRQFLMSHGLAYDERVRFAEDFALYVECLRAGGRWWMTMPPTYHYSIRSDSLTQVQTVHDLGRLRERQRAMLGVARESDDQDLERAVRHHMRTVDRSYYYRLVTDHLKAGRYRAGLAVAFGSARAAALVLQESLHQAPVIARKAIAGGYRAPNRSQARIPY